MVDACYVIAPSFCKRLKLIIEHILDKPKGRGRAVWHGGSTLDLDTSSTVVGVNCDFVRVPIVVDNPEENGEIELKT